MRKLKVFVASSERAYGLVEALVEELKEDSEVQVIPWRTPASFPNNQQLLETLAAHSRTCDLAVVFLTRDYTARALAPTSRRSPAWLPPLTASWLGKRRDVTPLSSQNCIFELGLLMGALGDTQRCLFFSSLPKHFADIEGQRYDPLSELNDGCVENREWCKDAVKVPAQRVRDQIGRGGRDKHLLDAISVEELMTRESKRLDLQRDSKVLVRAAQPAERLLTFARPVCANLIFGVDYHYLFDSAAANYGDIGVMLRSLAIAAVVEGADGLDDANATDEQFKAAILTHKEPIERNLQLMPNRLFVQFVPFPAFEEFCIYNHSRSDDSSGYLKWPGDRFVRIPADKTKARVAFYREFTHSSRETIFGTKMEIVQQAIAGGLKDEILARFPPELQDTVHKVCFGR